MGCFVVTEFLLTTALRDPSAIAEPLVPIAIATNFVSYAKHKPRAISAIFIPYESILGVHDRSEILFQYFKGRCHGNEFSGKNGAKLPTPCTYCLSIQNRMGYRDLNVPIKSGNDASISCKNFVNFGPVTPEKTVLICILFLRHSKKLAYFVKYLRKYWTNFYNLYTIWKCFECRW